MTAWMKVEHVTPEKPEIFEIAEIMELDPENVFAKVFRVWVWFDQHSEDGSAPETLRASLERKLGAPGFLAAMERVQWLETFSRRRRKFLRIPNFDRHVGQSAKKRALTAVRNAKFRNTKDGELTPGTSLERHLEKDKSKSKSKNKNKRGAAKPWLECPEWIHGYIWAEFIQHRKEIGASLTKTATAALIKKLDKYRQKGVSPNAAIQISIANQWRGVFPEKLLVGNAGPGSVTKKTEGVEHHDDPGLKI